MTSLGYALCGGDSAQGNVQEEKLGLRLGVFLCAEDTAQGNNLFCVDIRFPCFMSSQNNFEIGN
jgi:hypothetical protein